MNDLTGYDGWSFYVHQGVLVLPDGAPLWLGRAMDAPGARITTWLPDDHVRPYGVEISETVRVTESGAETLSSFPRQLVEV